MNRLCDAVIATKEKRGLTWRAVGAELQCDPSYPSFLSSAVFLDTLTRLPMSATMEAKLRSWIAPAKKAPPAKAKAKKAPTTRVHRAPLDLRTLRIVTVEAP